MGVVTSSLNALSSIFGLGGENATSRVLSSILNTRENVRVAQIKRYWEYYNGKYYDYVRQDGEMPYVNLCYSNVEKATSWLVGAPPLVKFREDIQSIMEEIYNEIMENSGGNTFFYEARQMGGVTGDCFIYIAYDPMSNYGAGGVAMKVLDSARTFVEYQNIGQQRKLSKVMMTWDELDDKGSVNTYLEVWTDEFVKVYPANVSMSLRNMGTFAPQPTSTGQGAEEGVTTFPNPYGELPFVHIPNIYISHNVYGRSDIHDLWTLNREINESLLSFKDNVNYHGNPLTLLFGVSAKNIEKGANKVWGNIPKDARIENLTVESTYAQISEYIRMLEKYTGLVNTPVWLMNLDQQMWADTTNSGMRLAFMPLEEMKARHVVSYGKGFKEAIEKAIRFQNTFFGLQLERLNSPERRAMEKLVSTPIAQDQELLQKILMMRMIPYFKVDVIFQEHIPRNRMYDLMDLDVELRNKLESVRGAMGRLGIVDPQAKMKEIFEDQQWISTLDALYAVMSQPPTPETQGTVDQTVATSAASIPGDQTTAGGAVQTEAQTGQSVDSQKEKKHKGGK